MTSAESSSAAATTDSGVVSSGGWCMPATTGTPRPGPPLPPVPPETPLAIAEQRSRLRELARRQAEQEKYAGEFLRDCVLLSGRELAVLQEMSRRHSRNKIVIRWHPDGTAAVLRPPKWAVNWLQNYRGERLK